MTTNISLRKVQVMRFTLKFISGENLKVFKPLSIYLDLHCKANLAADRIFIKQRRVPRKNKWHGRPKIRIEKWTELERKLILLSTSSSINANEIFEDWIEIIFSEIRFTSIATILVTAYWHCNICHLLALLI